MVIMGKDKFKNIIIGVMAMVILILICILIFGKVNSCEVKYKFYDDNLIEIKNDSSLKVQANVYDNRSLAILLTSNNSKEVAGNISVKAYNEDGDVLLSDNNYHILFARGQALSIFNLPDLKNKNAGKIEIMVKEEETDYKGDIDVSKIKYTTSFTVAEKKETSINVNLKNENSKIINKLSGYVIALKNNKIVGVNVIEVSNIGADGVTTKTTLNPNIMSDELKALEFDKLSLVIVSVN